MPKKESKRKKTVKGAHSSDRERRVVILYPNGTVRLISTWKGVPAPETYAQTLADYMDAKLIVKED